MQHIIAETGCLTKISKPCRTSPVLMQIWVKWAYFKVVLQGCFFYSDHVLNSIIVYLLKFLGFLPSLWWSKWRLCHAQGLYCGQSEARTDSSQGNGSVIIVNIDKPCILMLRTLPLIQSFCWWEFALLLNYYFCYQGVYEFHLLKLQDEENKCKEHQSSLFTL